jgi:hypothetical protein
LNLSNRYSIIKPESIISDSIYFKKEGDILDLILDNSINNNIIRNESKKFTSIQLKMHDDYKDIVKPKNFTKVEKVFIKSKTAMNYSYHEIESDYRSNEKLKIHDKSLEESGYQKNIYNQDKIRQLSSGISKNHEYESDI